MHFPFEHKKAYIGLGLAALIIFGSLIWASRPGVPQGPSTTEGNSNVSENTPDTSGAAEPAVANQPPVKNGQSTGTGSTGATNSITRLGVRFATPTTGDVWAIGSNHIIVWNKEASTPGGLYLVDASGATVGWVLASTGANQASFQWDTRDVSVDRTGGTRKNIVPGMYALRFVVDGKSGQVSSAPFAISAEGTPQSVSFVYRLKSTKVTPSVLTVPHGANVVFVNNETKTQQISSDGFEKFSVSSLGGIYVLNTTALIPKKTYNWLSDLYTYQAPGTLIVE